MGDTENTFWKDGEIRFLDNTPEPRAALFIQQPIKMLLLRKRSEDQDHLFLSILHCFGKFSALQGSLDRSVLIENFDFEKFCLKRSRS